MTEHEIQQLIMLAIGSRPGIRIWRNQTGALKDERGHLIRFGLVGSADILGIMSPGGRFLAIEVKTHTGRQTEQQASFQRMIESHGGLYVLARSVQDAVSALDRAQG